MPPHVVDLAALTDLAESVVPAAGRRLLGIAGVPGAGKSTLAEAIVAEAARRHGADWVAHVPMDGFHLADVQLERLGLRERKGAPETFDAGGYAALLRRIRTEVDEPVYAPGFDRTLEQPLAGAMVVPPAARLVVTEGNYLLLAGWERVREALDEVWLVELDDAVRLDRLVARHIRFGKEPDHARSWVASVDEPNAARIRTSSTPPDRVLTEGPGGWTLRRPERPPDAGDPTG